MVWASVKCSPALGFRFGCQEPPSYLGWDALPGLPRVGCASRRTHGAHEHAVSLRHGVINTGVGARAPASTEVKSDVL
jgi:hypothetical protein